MMSENRLLSSSSDVLVEEQVIEDNTNDAVVKIIENVEVNLLQEEIDNLKEEKSAIKEWSTTKTNVLGVLSFSGIVVSIALAVVTGLLLSHINIPISVAVGVFLIVIGTSNFCIFLDKSAAPITKKQEKDDKINSKRQELFEKSLKVKIVNKDEIIIDEKWREVIAFDDNDDYVKFLTRIVENSENDNEIIEAKRLKG